MYVSRIISNEQIVKVNSTEDQLYVCELKGPYTRTGTDNGTYNTFHSIILIQRGSIRYILNGQKGEVIQGSLLNIPPWTEISYLKYSADFMGMTVSASNRFMLDIFRNLNLFQPHFGFRMRYMTHLPLSSKESKTVAMDIEGLCRGLGNREHSFSEELTKVHFYILLIDIADAVWKRFGEGIPGHTAETSRKEKLLDDFILYMHENIDRETKVGFYAEKLCISKQYLALIVKEMLQVPAGQVIARARYERAAKLLAGTSMTIQQIADKMSFSDQSSFGKFFRKQGGQSPLAYRKSLRKKLLSMRAETDIR